MSEPASRDVARGPEDLGRLFLERANAGDVEGAVALYELEAVLAVPSGELAAGHGAIRALYRDLLAGATPFNGEVRTPLRRGDLDLTSTRFIGGATAEVARRQADGSWLWVVDQPNILR